MESQLIQGEPINKKAAEIHWGTHDNTSNTKTAAPLKKKKIATRKTKRQNTTVFNIMDTHRYKSTAKN